MNLHIEQRRIAIVFSLAFMTLTVQRRRKYERRQADDLPLSAKDKGRRYE